jgi:hypothetical protein
MVVSANVLLILRKAFMKLTVRNVAPPAGTYRMTLFQVDEGIGKWSNPIFYFRFRVCEDGEHFGQELSHTTSSDLKVGNSLHKLLEQLFGRTLAPNESVDLNELIGVKYLVEAQAHVQSGTRSVTSRIARVAPANCEREVSNPVANELCQDC